VPWLLSAAFQISALLCSTKDEESENESTTMTLHTLKVKLIFLSTPFYKVQSLGNKASLALLPSELRFFHAFSSVVRQMPEYNSPRRGMAHTVLITFLCCSMYCLFFCHSVYCLCVNVYCTAATGCQPNCS
jgi:hypothetical protein